MAERFENLASANPDLDVCLGSLQVGSHLRKDRQLEFVQDALVPPPVVSIGGGFEELANFS
jgi:hypothetical protein